MTNQNNKLITGSLLLLALCLLPACQAPHAIDVSHFVVAGEYGKARMVVRNNLEKKRGEREFLLDRMQLGILTLADGYPQSAQIVFEDVYQLLRTQGINADRTVASQVFYEGVKIWKGEPFEQALTFAYYSMQQAELGQWDNARAAASNGLFQLRDFGENKKGERLDTEEIARRAIEAERKAAGQPTAKDDYINTGYAVRESNFTLGYLLQGIARRQLGRTEEGNDFLNVAAQVDPSVRPVVDHLKSGQYNTVFVVSYGLGPTKVAYGMDNALAKFQPRFPSDDSPLIGRIVGQQRAAYPVVCDVNRMASDHMWNNMEDVRQAKSILGNVLLGAGAVTTGVGAHNDNDTAVLIGIGLMAAGALAKAGAHADTRYCNVMPQRMYVVPMMITQPNTTVELEVQGRPNSRIALAGLSPPPSGQPAQLRYVRLVSGVPRGGASASPAWATAGKVYYSTNQTGIVGTNPRPIILGGTDARTPTPAVIPSYQHDPSLATLTPAELEGLYTSQGVALTIEDQGGYAGLHVLEGGKSLVEPLVGTAGFARLFSQPHAVVQPPSR